MSVVRFPNLSVYIYSHTVITVIHPIALIKQSWTSITDPKTDASPHWQTQTTMGSTLLSGLRLKTRQQATEQATPMLSTAYVALPSVTQNGV
jgi:hypothetical protein